MPELTWLDIHEFALRQATTLPIAKSAWLAEARAARDPAILEEKIRAVEQPHEEEIEWAIAEWSRSGEWPAVSENTRFALRMRFDTAADWALTHEMPTGRSLVPVPDLGVREICAWLTTEWWEEYGRFDCAFAYCACSGCE